MNKRCDESVFIRISRPTGGSDGEGLEQRSEVSNANSLAQPTEKDPVLGKKSSMELTQSGVEDRLALQSAKKATQKMEIAYKRLNEKHRKILGILNKCIDLQNAQIDKKSLLHIDYLPVMQKPNDKLKISGIRKAENEEEIDRLQKQVTLLESQISGIKEDHREKMNQQDAILCRKMDEKSKLWKVYQSYCNPKVKIDHASNHTLYWKPPPAKQDRQSQQNQEFASQSFTKNVINSHKILTKKNIETRMNLEKKTPLFQTSNQNCQMPAEKVFDKADQMKQEEIKAEIKSLFTLICKQEDYLERVMKQEGHKLKNATVNQIKNRKNGLKIDEQLINQCLKTQYDRSKYLNWMKEENNFQRFQKELRQKQMAAQTFTTIRDL